MTRLADRLRDLSASTRTEVSTLRTYWSDTREAWKVVREAAAFEDDSIGVLFGFDRPPFSSSPDERRALSAKAEGYRQKYLASAVVQQLHGAFDAFLLNLFRLWLTAHPRHLLRSGRGQKPRELSLRTVIDAPDRAAVIAAVVEREVRELAYRSLPEQFEALGRLVKLNRPTDEERGRLVELKSSRDLLVHGGGVVDADYLRRSGPFARFAEGERLQLPDEYLAAAFDLTGNVVREMSDAALAKAADAPARG